MCKCEDIFEKRINILERKESENEYQFKKIIDREIIRFCKKCGHRTMQESIMDLQIPFPTKYKQYFSCLNCGSNWESKTTTEDIPYITEFEKQKSKNK